MLQPNINRWGRAARGVSGAVCILMGLLAWVIGWPASPGTRWIVSIAALAIGAFQLFEAKKAWCVMRACGIKTPL